MRLVSVVVSCHNSDPIYLNQSIESVLLQTYKNIQVIVVDDGSDVPVIEIVKKHFLDKIKIYRKKRSGLGDSLNYGISKSAGEYIARIDDDDLMLKDRIERQVAFLEKNTGVVCVGSHIQMIVKNKSIKYKRFPLNHDEIVSDLIALQFSLAHTSVMFRKNAFKQIGGYRVSGGGQDLDLFLQLGRLGAMANIDEYLTSYRLSLSGLSVKSVQDKWDAYIYALDSILNDGRYCVFRDRIVETISVLRNRRKRGYNPIYKRMILVLYVLILGKK